MEELFRRLLMAPVLDQDSQPMVLPIHGPPQIMTGAVDGEKDVAEVPLIIWPTTPATKLIGRWLAECAAPSADGFAGHCDPGSKSSSSTSR